MDRVVVFGKPGGGKSTLSKKLSAATGIKLCALDLIEYKQNGERVPLEEFSKKHTDLIGADSWIIDGLGKLVKILGDKDYNRGYHSVIWDGMDGQGNTVASGIYYYRLKSKNFYSPSNRMILLK